MNKLEWKHGYRCWGYWVGSLKLGHIELSVEHRKPLVVSWTFICPDGQNVKGACSNVRKGKSLIEQALRNYLKVNKIDLL
jgi:hypothetical protein